MCIQKDTNNIYDYVYTFYQCTSIIQYTSTYIDIEYTYNIPILL